VGHERIADAQQAGELRLAASGQILVERALTETCAPRNLILAQTKLGGTCFDPFDEEAQGAALLMARP